MQHLLKWNACPAQWPSSPHWWCRACPTTASFSKASFHRKKAGKPGWAAIIPIYNAIVLLEIANKPIWWILLFLIPCVGIVFYVLTLIDLSKFFGQSPAFSIGLLLLPFVFFPILGFGGAQYRPVGPTTF